MMNTPIKIIYVKLLKTSICGYNFLRKASDGHSLMQLYAYKDFTYHLMRTHLWHGGATHYGGLPVHDPPPTHTHIVRSEQCLKLKWKF